MDTSSHGAQKNTTTMHRARESSVRVVIESTVGNRIAGGFPETRACESRRDSELTLMPMIVGFGFLRLNVSEWIV